MVGSTSRADTDRMITVENVTKRYGDKLAVDDLSFNVKPGVVTGFLGPNGAGKSTTMRLILGLDAPTSGSANIDGRPYSDLEAPLHEVGAMLEARAIHTGRSAYNHLLALAQTHGIGRERVLIKLASTWEGIRAAEVLQKEGIHCNMTLLFSLAQAAACAEAGAQLISPFVGRIYDWYKKNAGSAWDEAKDGGANDPGVKSVRRIYAYYKKFGYKTEVMGASFRTPGQILELAGCDLLTISPDLLQKLQESTETVERKLSPEMGTGVDIERVPVDESSFRFLVNDEAMATEKLAEGIRAFAADAVKLEKMIEALR